MRYIIAHGHIFKNAGTTFDSALKTAFDKEFCDHRDDASMRRGGADYLNRFILDNPQIKAISSHHLCNPLPVSDEYLCVPFYFVRDPIERVISVYNFEKKQRGVTLGSRMAIKLNIIDYVRWRLTPESPRVIRNYQTAYIGAHGRLSPEKHVSIEHFNNVLEVFNSKYAFIGVVEKFDESFARAASFLSELFPKHKFRYSVKNVSNLKSYNEKKRLAYKTLSPVITELVQENYYDLKLHQLMYDSYS